MNELLELQSDLESFLAHKTIKENNNATLVGNSVNFYLQSPRYGKHKLEHRISDHITQIENKRSKH